MTTSTMNHMHAAFALALALPTLSGTAAAQQASGSISYGIAPALDCKDVSKTAAAGNWVEANGIGTEFGAVRRANLSFSNPVATDIFHVMVNGAGTRALALVEIQDAQGSWHKAWEGKIQPPVPGFDQTCFEQKLPQKQVVQGLRFTFGPGAGQIELNHAALLRR